MPILGITASSISGNLFASNYESISTITVGSGGVTNVEFTSIPATYTHLQLRCTVKAINVNIDRTNMNITINSGTQNVYSHRLTGDGSAVSSTNNNGYYYGMLVPGTTSYTNLFTGAVIDFLDYANTNKNKTVRGFGGFDNNGSGFVILASCLFNTTTAISSIKIETDGGAFTGWAEYSSFALYGIKGA
jgi:hypothetical protein